MWRMQEGLVEFLRSVRKHVCVLLLFALHSDSERDRDVEAVFLQLPYRSALGPSCQSIYALWSYHQNRYGLCPFY